MNVESVLARSQAGYFAGNLHVISLLGEPDGPFNFAVPGRMKDGDSVLRRCTRGLRWRCGDCRGDKERQQSSQKFVHTSPFLQNNDA